MGSCDGFHLGDIVYSSSGRDKGRHYIVMYTEENLVGICDGDLHKTDKGKKKNPKHLRQTGGFCEYVRGKLTDGEKVTNSEIRRSVSEFEEALEKQGKGEF